MATFLSLCQDVANDSGTTPNRGEPTTVVGQADRLARVVTWVQEAWRDVQNHHPHWRWMQAQFEGNCIVNNRDYDGSSFVTTRFSRFEEPQDGSTQFFSLYDSTIGRGDERRLTFVEWQTFEEKFLWGEQDSTDTGKPVYVSIAPDGKLNLHPIPDAAYKVRGWYMKAQQDLTEDASVPEMPLRFHDIIKWGALKKLGTFDEAPNQMPLWKEEYDRLMTQLINDQTPNIRMPEAFA